MEEASKSNPQEAMEFISSQKQLTVVRPNLDCNSATCFLVLWQGHIFEPAFDKALKFDQREKWNLDLCCGGNGQFRGIQEAWTLVCQSRPIQAVQQSSRQRKPHPHRIHQRPRQRDRLQDTPHSRNQGQDGQLRAHVSYSRKRQLDQEAKSQKRGHFIQNTHRQGFHDGRETPRVSGSRSQGSGGSFRMPRYHNQRQRSSWSHPNR